MKHTILAFAAMGIALSAFAQGDSVLSAQQWKVLKADVMRQAAALEESQLRVQGLGDAINALKAAKGDEREVAALDELLGEMKHDCETAREAYGKRIDALKDVEFEKGN